MPDVRQYGRRILDRENAASIIEESRGPCIDRVPLSDDQSSEKVTQNNVSNCGQDACRG